MVIQKQSLVNWSAAAAFVIIIALQRHTLPYAIGSGLLILAAVVLERRKIPFLLARFQLIFPLLFIFSCGNSLFHYFNYCDVGDVEFACYTDIIRNTLHGHFLFQSQIGQNALSIHSSLTILVFLPVYFLFGNVGLIVCQSLCWVGGIYILCRENREMSWLLILACATSLCVFPVTFFGFHTDIIFFPFAAWALISFKHQRFCQFLLSCICLILTKEAFVWVVLAFFVVGLLEKRSIKWAVPSLIAVTYLSIWWFFLAPALRQGSQHFFNHYVPNLSGIISQFASMSTLVYLAVLFLAYAPIILSGKLRWIIFPAGLALFYCIFPDPFFRDYWRHYSASVGFMMLFPLVSIEEKRMRHIIFPMLVTSLCSYPMWFNVVFPKPSIKNEASSITEVLSKVPERSSLVVFGPCVTRASNRDEIADWNYKPSDWKDYSFLLFDLSFTPVYWRGHERDTLEKAINDLRLSSQWTVADERGQVILFKKK
jgi:uncharacterized membrane protein